MTNQQQTKPVMSADSMMMLSKDEITALDKLCFPEEPNDEANAAWLDTMGGNEMNKLLWMGYKLLEYRAQLAQPPEGYVLVPKIMTDEMHTAFARAFNAGIPGARFPDALDEGYKAMIAAAPKDTGADMAPATAGKQGGE